MKELVELVLTDLERKSLTGEETDAQLTCLEVGCGSGAISLSLLRSLPQVRFMFMCIKVSRRLAHIFSAHPGKSSSFYYIHCQQRFFLLFLLSMMF